MEGNETYSSSVFRREVSRGLAFFSQKQNPREEPGPAGTDAVTQATDLSAPWLFYCIKLECVLWMHFFVLSSGFSNITRVTGQIMAAPMKSGSLKLKMGCRNLRIKKCKIVPFVPPPCPRVLSHSAFTSSGETQQNPDAAEEHSFSGRQPSCHFLELKGHEPEAPCFPATRWCYYRPHLQGGA